MSKYDRLKKQSDIAFSEARADISNFQIIAEESKRVSNVAYNAGEIISDLDRQFAVATKLNKTDIAFLMLATALQCVRQYVLDVLTQRTDDATAANNTKGHGEEHSDRHHRLYNPSLEEIITNPVPFDAIYGGKDFDLGIGGGFTHRAKTIGHDPLLGWIFGTMNIATSTVTVSEGLSSYHVLTGTTKNGATRDKISQNADTFKVFSNCKKKLTDQGIDGKTIIGASLMKEAIHLRSDLYSTASLPIPIVSTISVDAARKLADYGIDMGNTIKTGSQAGFAVLINSLIGMLHGLFYDSNLYPNEKLYAVKTRKILSYSNVIASSSNILYTVISHDLQRLDIGGLAVTLYRLITDYKFVQNVKYEFLDNQWYGIVMGDEFTF